MFLTKLQFLNTDFDDSFCPSSSPIDVHFLVLVQLRIVKEVFELFDTDGQNELDEVELASALYALGFSQEHYLEVTLTMRV